VTCETCKVASAARMAGLGYCRYCCRTGVPVHFNSAARRLDDGGECQT